ncbi:MAG TPA: hypothetical protein VFZ67_12870 [Nitrososphaera sp.]
MSIVLYHYKQLTECISEQVEQIEAKVERLLLLKKGKEEEDHHQHYYHQLKLL